MAGVRGEAAGDDIVGHRGRGRRAPAAGTRAGHVAGCPPPGGELRGEGRYLHPILYIPCPCPCVAAAGLHFMPYAQYGVWVTLKLGTFFSWNGNTLR